ncbi:hypothetical protein DdX_18352 [Ditylenchus destructor]|uniref:Uncharacterized protein n=1 Tax=Ditylenchus destructor TaxID=166010 RepID=A0AAD4MMH4_9BILA|nr:hypothetical protein DdX_18352 [Ditylenchus destructor]
MLANNISTLDKFVDHNIVKFDLAASALRVAKPLVKIRKFSDEQFSRLNFDLLHNDWSQHLDTCFSIKTKYEAFATKLKALFDHHCPEKTVHATSKCRYPMNIRILSKQKLNLYRLAIKNTSIELLTEYKLKCKEYRSAIFQFHLEQDFRLFSKSPKSFYGFLKGKLGKDRREIPTLISSNGDFITDDLTKATKFAEFFSNNLRSKKLINDISIPSGKADGHSLQDIKFNSDDIRKRLSKLPARNSTCPDSIPFILLKNCSSTLAPILTELFRIILDEGNIPQAWRRTNLHFSDYFRSQLSLDTIPCFAMKYKSGDAVLATASQPACRLSALLMPPGRLSALLMPPCRLSDCAHSALTNARLNAPYCST